MGRGLASHAAVLCALSLLGAAAPAQAAPVLADRDGDGVFDNLESSLSGLDAGDDVRVVVTLDADATRNRAARIEEDVPTLDVKRRFAVVDAVAAVVDAGRVRELAAAPGVTHVERDVRVHATNASAQQWFGVTEARLDLPGLDGDRDGAPATYSPADMVAAVIDTGIDAGHVDLDGGKVLAFQDFTDGSYTDSDTAFDDEGHGTHVAGTIAGDGDGDGRANGRGVAPRAGLVGLKVLDAEGNGWSSDVIAAIDWVWKDPDGVGPAQSNGALYGIEAINLSLGGEGCADGTDAESAAVNKAVAAGYVVAVAAGNEGAAPCTISSPAAAAGAITVGAMADVSQWGFYLAGFSSRGPTLDGRIKPDVSAPGVRITSAAANTSSGYSLASGTSMASPFVAGLALLMRDLNPLLTPAQLKQRLMETAIDWGRIGTDSDHGAGRLDAYAALAASAATASPELTTPPSPLPGHQRIHSNLVGGAGSKRTFTVTGSGFPLTIGLTVGDPATDFDMVLRNSSGTEVARAESPHRQDELHLTAVPIGEHTLEVVSHAGAGDFSLDLSGGFAVATADQPTVAPDAAAPAAAPEPIAAPVPEDAPSVVEEPGPGAVVEPPPAVPTAPTRAAIPELSGTARHGAVFRLRPGAWTGTGPIAVGYLWLRCDAAGERCTRVVGANTARYSLTARDVGHRIRGRVIASNEIGSARATSAASAVVRPAPPVARKRPSVGGYLVRGMGLVARRGRWWGTPHISLSVRWLRCSRTGRACKPVARRSAYMPGEADVGHRLRLRVTAVNRAGRRRATSRATAVVR